MKPLTVGELIEKLGAFNPSLPVMIEGCDCVGDAAGVVEWIEPEVLDSRGRTWPGKRAVLIERDSDPSCPEGEPS